MHRLVDQFLRHIELAQRRLQVFQHGIEMAVVQSHILDQPLASDPQGHTRIV